MDQNAKNEFEREWGEILRMIDAATSPDKMTPGAAVELLEELQTEIAGRLDALRDEMKAAGQEWA